MIINSMCGGLGNQLFQISAGFALSLRLKTTYGINYQIGGMGPGQGKINKTYKQTLYSKIKTTTNLVFKPYKQDFMMDDIEINIFVPIPLIDNVCLVGYFQSQKYFEDYQNEIRNLFVFPKEKKLKIREKFSKFKKKKVGVHIRMGDYQKIKEVLPPVSQNYIFKALSFFNKKDHDFFLFTDDLESVKKNFDISNYNFLNNNDEIDDMISLSMCDSVIMSNSTFSWWGSWFGDQKEKVIAPKNWFGPKGAKHFQDLYRDEMIKL